MSGKKSRNKGKRGELEAAAELRRVLGVAARRGRQFKGTDDSPDLVTGVEGVHFEVKRVERLSLYAAMAQAEEDCVESVPVVLHKANRKPWVAIVYLDDLPELTEKLRGES
jgi:hypothetical protein